jgi:hypothetical protein
MLPDLHDGKARRRHAPGNAAGDGVAHFSGDLLGDTLAVENSRWHRIAA